MEMKSFVRYCIMSKDRKSYVIFPVFYAKTVFMSSDKVRHKKSRKSLDFCIPFVSAHQLNENGDCEWYTSTSLFDANRNKSFLFLFTLEVMKRMHRWRYTLFWGSILNCTNRSTVFFRIFSISFPLVEALHIYNISLFNTSYLTFCLMMQEKKQKKKNHSKIQFFKKIIVTTGKCLNVCVIFEKSEDNIVLWKTKIYL